MTRSRIKFSGLYCTMDVIDPISHTSPTFWEDILRIFGGIE